MFDGKECAFLATTGGQMHASRWAAHHGQMSRTDEVMNRLLGSPGPTPEKQWVQRFAGFVRVYRRRFREISVREQEHYEVGAGDLAVFRPAQDGTPLEIIVREVEEFLFILAQIRESLDALEVNTTLQLPVRDAWERYEPLIAASGDAMDQRLHPMLDAFYGRYEELRGLLGQLQLPFLTNSSRSRVPAIMARLDLLGTQAIWAFEDARHAVLSREAGRGLEIALDVNTGVTPWPRERGVHIRLLALDNIRRFDKRRLDLKSPASESIGQWLLLLGENGTGKTTLLRAIALALIDEDVAQSLVTQVSADAPLVRMDSDPRGASGPESPRSSYVCILN